MRNERPPPRRQSGYREQDTGARSHSVREPEQRIYGVNACLAAFDQRPQDVRKLWLTQTAIPTFKNVLAWCVANRIGYRVVEVDDLQRLTSSSHHEGVCFDLRLPRVVTLDDLITSISPQSSALLLWLDAIGNPHNLGAILRSAAHFGVTAVLMPATSGVLSGAAVRVAEGGAEIVPVLRIENPDAAFAQLRHAGFALAATVVRGGDSIFSAQLPLRLVLLLGAESEGLPDALSATCELRLCIPGSGAVESLNVSVAAALCMAEWAKVHFQGKA